MSWLKEVAENLGQDAEKEPFIRPGLQAKGETVREKEGEILGVPPQNIPETQEVFKGSGVENEPLVNVPMPKTKPPSKPDRLIASIIILTIVLIILSVSMFGDPEVHNFVFSTGSIFSLIVILIVLYTIRDLSTFIASILIAYILLNMLMSTAFHVGYGLRIFLTGLVTGLTIILFYQTASPLILLPVVWWMVWFYYVMNATNIDLFLLGGPN